MNRRRASRGSRFDAGAAPAARLIQLRCEVAAALSLQWIVVVGHVGQPTMQGGIERTWLSHAACLTSCAQLSCPQALHTRQSHRLVCYEALQGGFGTGCAQPALGMLLASLPNELLKPKRVIFSWPCLAGVSSRVQRARKPQYRSRRQNQRLWCESQSLWLRLDARGGVNRLLAV